MTPPSPPSITDTPLAPEPNRACGPAEEPGLDTAGPSGVSGGSEPAPADKGTDMDTGHTVVYHPEPELNMRVFELEFY